MQILRRNQLSTQYGFLLCSLKSHFSCFSNVLHAQPTVLDDLPQKEHHWHDSLWFLNCPSTHSHVPTFTKFGCLKSLKHRDLPNTNQHDQMIFLFFVFLFLIGKHELSTQKRQQGQVLQVAAKYKQKDKETAHQHPIQKK